MRKTLLVASVVMLGLATFGCGAGGGTADPKQIADAVLSDFRNEDFTSIPSYYPHYYIEITDQTAKRDAWRLNEGWNKWKRLKERLSEGDNALDPKDKSGVTESQEAWLEASPEQRWAVNQGFYRIYGADDWEKRLKESDWYWADRSVNLQDEGEGSAEFRYRNNYSDGLKVTLLREGGLWYLQRIEFSFDKKMEEKPKDE